MQAAPERYEHGYLNIKYVRWCDGSAFDLFADNIWPRRSEVIDVV